MIQYILSGGIFVVLCGVVATVSKKKDVKECEDHRNCIEGELQKHLIILTEVKKDQEHVIEKLDKIIKISVKRED